MKKFYHKMAQFAINLQLFADAGTLVNATGNYVNAYTGATEAFSGKNTLSGELKTFYDTELLENARVELFYAQFGKKQPLPAGRGKTIEWRKWNTFDRATQLTEGVIPTGQKFGMSSKTASINQYGTYASISDELELRAYDDVILGATEEMGASAAETQEVLIRDALYTNTNVMYCDVLNSSGVYQSTPVSGATLYADSNNGYAYFTPDMVAKAVTKMKKDRVPTIGGKYVAVIHPSVAKDLRSASDWVEAHKYAQPTELFNGEIGELHGMRFVEDVFAPVLKGADLEGDARNLTVASFNTSTKAVGIDETLTSEEQAALVGRPVFIDGVAYVVKSCSAASSFVVEDAPASNYPADGDVIYPGEGGALGIAAYATYVFGQDAFGIIDPEGGALQMIVHNKDEAGGPLNQFSTIGYKFTTNGATVLYPERCLRIMSSSSYSEIDDAN